MKGQRAMLLLLHIRREMTQDDAVQFRRFCSHCHCSLQQDESLLDDGEKKELKLRRTWTVCSRISSSSKASSFDRRSDFQPCSIQRAISGETNTGLCIHP